MTLHAGVPASCDRICENGADDFLTLDCRRCSMSMKQWIRRRLQVSSALLLSDNFGALIKQTFILSSDQATAMGFSMSVLHAL